MTHYAPTGTRTAPPERLSLVDKLRAVVIGVTVPRPRNARTPADVGLPFDTVRVPVGSASSMEGWLIRAADVGAARGVVLLFHGYAASKDSLLEAAVAFHDLGWTCLLLDFRGSGGSDGDRTTIGFTEAEDVAAAVSWTAEALGAPRPVLYGTSMGAAAVLRAMAAEHVPARALVLESPFDRLLTTVEHRFEALGLPPVPGAMLLLFWGSVDGGFNSFAHNPVTYASHVAAPTLVLHGAHDPRVREAEARAVADHIAGPHELVVFPDAGHGIAGVVPPNQWRDPVARFLATV
jgi:dipeptidyl aminopeptidase/acylaminoacyl peptidase